MPKIDGRTMTAEPFWNMSQNEAAKIRDHERIIREDSDVIIQQEVRENDTDITMSAAQLSDYGANNF
jgi:hypothetical protein